MMENKHPFLRKALVAVLAYSMVVAQSPLGMVAYADEAQPAAAEQAADASTVSVGLYLSDAYIATADGQTMDARTSAVSLPVGKDFRFSAAANSGYELSTVAYELGGTQTILTPDADGLYTLPAAAVVDGVQIRLTTSQTATAPAATATPLAGEGAESAEAGEGTEAAEETPAEAAKSEYVYEDDDVKVTATLEQASAVPDDAQFVVTPVTPDSKDADGNPTYDYDAYLAALNKKAGATDDEPVYTGDNTLLYDVAFLVDGKEVEPAEGTVKVKFVFKKDQLADIDAEKADDVALVHLPLADDVTAGIDTTADATDVAVDDITVEAPKASDVADTLNAADLTLDDLSVVAATTAGKQDDAATDDAQATDSDDSADLTAQETTAPEGADYTSNGKVNGFYSFTDESTGATYSATFNSYNSTWCILRSSFSEDTTEITVPVVLPDKSDPTVTHPVSVFDPQVYPANKTITKVTMPDNPNLVRAELANLSALTDIDFGSPAMANALFSSMNALRFDDSITEITVPAGVTKLGYGVFSYMKGLKSVKFEGNGLTEVGSQAFANDPALTTVELPESVTTVGYAAFQNCSSLASIDLPDGITSMAQDIFQGTKIEHIDIPSHLTSLYCVFENCTTLKSVTIPAGVTDVTYAFRKCTGLESITFEEGSALTSIGKSFAAGCSSLTSVEGVPASVTSIEQSAFDSDYELKTFTGGENVTTFGAYVFFNDSRLTSVGDIDMSRVTSIGPGAFKNCGSCKFSEDGSLNLTSLQELKPETSKWENYRAWTFCNCYEITSITIGEGVTEIPNRCFYGLSNKCTSVTLPNSVRAIRGLAFAWGAPVDITIGHDGGSLLETIEGEAFRCEQGERTVTINAAEDDVNVNTRAFEAHGDGANDVVWTVPSVTTDNARIAEAEDAPTLQEAVDAVAAGDTSAYSDYIDYVADGTSTIKISKDIKLAQGVTVPTSGAANVRLVSKDGATIVASNDYAASAMFTVSEDSVLTLGEGITVNARHDGGKPIVTSNAGTVVLDGAKLTGVHDPADSHVGAIKMIGGTLQVKGGLITGNSLTGSYGSGAVVLTDGATMEMTGGDITSNIGSSTGAGGVYVGAKCSFTMSGGTIAQNHGYRGGGVLLDGDNTSTGNFPNDTTATMTMNGGTIDNNYADVRGAYNNGGGGVYVYWNAQFTMNGGTISNNRASGSQSAGGGVATEALNAAASYNDRTRLRINAMRELSGGGFTMKGGIISGNSAVSGGGIYSFSQNTVDIKAGRIEGNSASYLGGGIYIAIEPYTVRLSNALVTGNSASVSGGGVWLCPEGEALSNDYGTTDGATSALGGGNIAVFDNTAAQAGDDVNVLNYITNEVKGAENYAYAIGNAALGGGHVAWYRDGLFLVVKGSGPLGAADNIDSVQPSSSNYRYGTENSAELTEVNTGKGNYPLKAVMTNDAKVLAAEAASVIIMGNTAPHGGGIAGNGTYIIPHTAGSTQVSVTKAWEGNLDDAGKPRTTDSVEVELVGTKDGKDYVLGSATLSEANKWAYQWTDLDDSFTYTVREKDVPEGYTSRVTSAEDNPYDFTITNVYQEAKIELTKHYFGSDPNAAFSFLLTPTDSDWQPVDGAVGTEQTNGAFDENGEAKVVFTIKRDKKDATYHYVLSEVGGGDDTVYHVTVAVDKDGNSTVSYEMVAADGTTAKADTADFYNNETVRASARRIRRSARSVADQGVAVAPVVQKVLTNGALTDGAYSFTMTCTSGNDLDAEGNAYTTAAENDAAGKVAFDVRRYYEPGTYTYEIREVDAGDETVVYDGKTITATVTVTKGEDGALTADVAYSDDDAIEGNDSQFTNTLRGVNVRVQKTSKNEGNAPLENARYGLWLYNPGGNDVYLGNQVSDENGYMTFENVPTTPGAVYYFKEEHAPAGHLVNPYRDPYFTIVETEGSYKLVYEGQAEFDTATGMQTASD